MALISLQNISLNLGTGFLLDNQTLQIEADQRICLLGKNGAGKSSLMKLISGKLPTDAGEIVRAKDLRVAMLGQDVPEKLDQSLGTILSQGFRSSWKEAAALCLDSQDYSIIQDGHIEDFQELLKALNLCQSVCRQLGISLDWQYNQLSGGQKRRILLAQALSAKPDLLLLDEPTNHLDITTITWMEDFILRHCSSLLFVTHDRSLLRRLATRIIELDRGKLVDWSCDYDTFIKRKEAVLANEEKEWERFDQKLAQEEIWIRKGIKARRTRNEGRVRALLDMREERKNRRLRQGNASLTLQESGRSGKMVLEAKDLCFSYDNKEIIRDFSTTIYRGDKIGIIGPNGAGKTTLVRLLLGQLSPQAGSIRRGTNLEIIYFDQLRAQLDDSKSVQENVLPNGEMVQRGDRTQHIYSYLQDFLFTPERAKSPVAHLSGGEKNRLLLARLFTQAANFLVLDEPTNDLDVETLELLEELLVDFQGSFLLISHDRTFLNNTITNLYGFLPDNKGLVELAGDYSDWERYLSRQNEVDETEAESLGKKAYEEHKKQNRQRKMNFKERKELEDLPKQIEALEQEQKELHHQMSLEDFYKDGDKVAAANKRLQEIETQLETSFLRWEELEALDQSLNQ
ncbi:MAG: ATP-binding cassette domain-containing protein [Spirochaetales bacterium]|nr:ATP-binding cassette domain-containing protein [Spirochaetales bacterium]